LELGKVDILIVDDRREGLMALEAVLSNPEYNIIKALSGREALSQLLLRDFALILLDVQMPDMDGFETASIIKKRERSKNIPIIFVTAISKEEGFVTQGYDVGAVDYVFKPFDPHILKAKVAVFVDLFRKNRKLERQAKLLRESEIKDRARLLAELEIESLRRYRSLADAMPQIVARGNADGFLDYFNKHWTEYSGLSNEQSIGNGWQAAFYPEDLERLLEAWQKAKESGSGFSAECRIRHVADKEFRWHIMRGVPEFDEQGHMTAWITTATDCHDLKTSEQSLQRAMEAAEAASRAKSQFLANMSHEIRTPLGAMLGFAELLLNPNQSEAERREFVETVRRNGQQLSKIIDEILDISKVEAGRLDVESIETSMRELVLDVWSLLKLSAREKGLDLRFEVKDRLPADIYSDPTRLRQILFNVVGNAIKFSESGMVLVTASFDGSHAVFDVKDNGPGLSDEQAKTLFQPFTQADSSTTRKFGGTGLGLALSRSLARALGGDLFLLESHPGHGSTFRIKVGMGTEPIREFITSFTAQEDSKVQSKPFVSEKPLLKGMRVLLVEDSPDNQFLVSKFLKIAGAEVEIASNGREGVEKAVKGDHAVVLMDIQMPVLDGYGATTQLRSQGYQKPIIALTAHAMKEERQRCLAAGCNDHLTKPINRAKLIHTVAELASRQAIH